MSENAQQKAQFRLNIEAVLNGEEFTLQMPAEIPASVDAFIRKVNAVAYCYNLDLRDALAIIAASDGSLHNWQRNTILSYLCGQQVEIL